MNSEVTAPLLRSMPIDDFQLSLDGQRRLHLGQQSQDGSVSRLPFLGRLMGLEPEKGNSGVFLGITSMTLSLGYPSTYATLPRLCPQIRPQQTILLAHQRTN